MSRGGLELVWPGKYDPQGQRVPVPSVEPHVARLAQWPGADTAATADRVLWGDNLTALTHLAQTEPGSVDLVYIDPPFATGGRFSVMTRVGEGERGKGAFELEAPAYTDRFNGGEAGFLRMLDPRLRLLHRVLAPSGSLYLHVDPTVGHAVKLLLDEVFGPGCFQREIVWRIGWISGFKSKAKNWIRNHDLIFFYVKDPTAFTFNKHYVPYPEGYVRRDGKPPTGKGVPIDDVWNANETEFSLRGAESLDSIQIKSFSTEKSGYATQKNESIARRIIAASSNPGDRVLDAFCGSGTVGVAARQLGRQFVGVDCSWAAVHITTKRLRTQVGPDLVLDRVQAEPADQPNAFEELVRAHHAPPKRDVVVLGPTRPATREAIEDAVAQRGPDPLDVVAPRYDIPLQWRPTAQLLRVTDDVRNPAVAVHPGAAIVPLPSIELSVRRSESGAVTVSLDRYRVEFVAPSGIDAELGPLDTLDAWSLSWDPESVGVWTFRTHQDRTLAEALCCPERTRPTTLMLRFVDVRYQRSEVVLELEYARDVPRISSARLR